MAKNERDWRGLGRRVVLYYTAHDSQQKNGEYRRQSDNERKARPAVCGAAIFSAMLRKQDFNGSDRQVNGRPRRGCIGRLLSHSPNLPHPPHRRLLLIIGEAWRWRRGLRAYMDMPMRDLLWT
jgi:hypothetical protein